MNKEFEALDRLYKCNDDDYTLGYRQHDYKLLQLALTTKSKKEQALEIIKEKEVDVNLLNIRHSAETYNDDYYKIHYSYDVAGYLLTEEEFNLIKEVLKNE